MPFLTFLADPSGSWLYIFGLLAATEATAALALQQWWAARARPGAEAAGRASPMARLGLAASSLFGLRLAALLCGLLIPPNSSDALILLAPLDRAVGALTVLVLVWALAFPMRRVKADLAFGGAAALALAGLAATWAAWARSVQAGATFFNGSLPETAWVLLILLLLAAGLWLVYRERARAPGAPFGLALLGLLLAGTAFHYLYPPAGSNAAGGLRWAELAAVPLALLMLYRRAARWPAAAATLVSPDVPAAAPFRPRPVWRQVAETVLVAGTVYFVLEFATGRFRVEGPSMQPNLYTGQYVLADKIAYRLGSPQRGDVVVVRPPIGRGQAFIKRLMGLPGDTLTVRDGKVWVDGQLATEPYIAAPPNYSGSWTLGPDQYFVLGDNRNDSSDSHVWGAVPRADITGKALFVYWPPTQVRVVPHYVFAAGK